MLKKILPKKVYVKEIVFFVDFDFLLYNKIIKKFVKFREHF